MNWLEGFVYGLVSGITELLPVSSQAHRQMLLQLFGVDGSAPISDLIVHISMAIALYFASRRYIARLLRERRAIQRRKRRGGNLDVRSAYDLRLFRGSVFPLVLIMLILLILTRNWSWNMLMLAGFSVLNGILLYAADRMPQGNKDSRHVSMFDSVVFGLFGALSAFSGISRVGASQAYASMRGVDRQQSLNWALLLSFPALLLMCIFDVVCIVSGGSARGSVSVIIGYFTAGIGAFIAMYMSAVFLHKTVNRMQAAPFAYYSWGIALFALVLYLIS